MAIKIFHVVGDRFTDFAATYDVVVRVSDLVASMRSGDLRHGAEARFVAGQGLSPERVGDLFRAAEETGHLDQMGLWKRLTPADRKLPHKGLSSNVSITTPLQVGEREFVSDLVLDENDCIVGDRVNGQHLQGMVLVEAARQMHVAVAEAFYIHRFPEGVSREYSFALMVLNNSFMTYCYPLALKLKLTMLAVDTTNLAQLRFYNRIEAIQIGQIVLQQELRSIVLPRKKAGDIEIKRGGLTLEAMQREYLKSGKDEARADAGDT